MSYQVLARKWRPKSFQDVVGQSHVLKILSNALSLGRVHHAYLFSGTRGVGKTSIARLLAKGLNCEQGITSTPCGVCGNCVDIEQGRFVDLLEIDAASRTKVEDTREILDNIQYFPTKGRFKVYLIDEVHMLSRSSFNALLKTLEEPPEHVKFLLATTDPQKLPITILSRCLHLHLSALEPIQITDKITQILQSEQITQEEKAVKLIAKAADGSMRDALSLTDQAIALGNGEVTTQCVTEMLGTLDNAVAFNLIEAIHHADGNALMTQIDFIARQGADWDNVLSQSIALLHQLAFIQLAPSAVGDYQDNEERLRLLAKSISPNDIQLFYQILLIGRKELAYAPNKRLGVEMTFLRALAFSPKKQSMQSPVSHEQVAQIIHQTPKNTASVAGKMSTQSQPVKTIDKNEPAEVTPQDLTDVSDSTLAVLQARQRVIEQENALKKSQKAEQPQPLKNKLSTQQQEKKIIQDDTIDDELPVETAETYQWQFSESYEPVDTSALSAKTVKSLFEHEKTPELIAQLIAEACQRDPWSQEIEQLTVPPLIKQIMINAFITEDDDKITLHVRHESAHLTKNQNNIKKMTEALSDYRKKTVEIAIKIDDDKSFLTPLEMRELIYQEKLAFAKKAVHEDKKIAMICELFNAKIDEESIRHV